jgi:hypothetical protein
MASTPFESVPISDHSHSFALSADIQQEKLLVYLDLGCLLGVAQFRTSCAEEQSYEKWHRWTSGHMHVGRVVAGWKVDVLWRRRQR